MNNILCPFLRYFMLVFFNGILVYSWLEAEHGTHLSKNFQVLADNALLVNPKKCQLGQSQLEFLGHLVCAQGIHADAMKIQAMVT